MFYKNNYKFMFGKFTPDFDNKFFIIFIALLYNTILLLLYKKSIWSLNTCISCELKPKRADNISHANCLLLIL